MITSVLFHQHIARRSLRNLEPVNTFYFLSKPGGCGKLYGVYQSTLKNMVSGASWPLLLLVVGALDKLLNLSASLLFFPL